MNEMHICQSEKMNDSCILLAGAATSIIFVATKLLLRQNYVSRDNFFFCRVKHVCAAKAYFCRDKRRV